MSDEIADTDEQCDQKEGKKSQATLMVELALERFALGVADTGEVFAVDRDGPNVALKLRGGRTSLGAALASAYNKRHGRVPTAAGRADALAVLEGLGAQLEPVELPLRVARYGRDRIVVDLGRPDGWSVVVSPGHWEVVERSPVLFARSNLTVPLPCPSERRDGGDGQGLSFFRNLNLSPDQWQLLIAWLVAALIPEVPHPVLALFGEQGTGKSTAGRIIGQVVDPSAAPLRSAPRNEDSWIVAAAGSWTVVLDNISTLSPWLSDALCRAVTGEGRVVRQLYTDTDVNVLRFRRCVVMTSIDAGALRGDLAERLVPLELERLDPTRRRTETDIIRGFEREHPRILCQLLDLLADVLDVLPEIHLNELPRMADFARVVAAVDRVMGWNTLDHYLGIGTQLSEDVIDADPVARAVIALLDEHGRWEGSASELLQRITPENPPKGWPAQPNVLTGTLKRAATALREVGIHAEQGAGRTRRTWYIARCEDTGNPSSPSPPPSPPSATNGSQRDDADRGTVTDIEDRHSTVTAEPLPLLACDGRDDGDDPPLFISHSACPGCGGPSGSFSVLCPGCSSLAAEAGGDPLEVGF